MPDKPQFSYFLYHSEDPVSPGSSLWQMPLPLNRTAAAKLINKAHPPGITHGDCFLAARRFLERNQCAVIVRAVGRCLQRPVERRQLAEIRIVLAKHGEFYHPCRIETVVDGQKISFVLNLAISTSGMRHILAEYQTIKRLNHKYRFSYLPQVYELGNLEIADTLSVSMFLGEWFDGYHEYHISRDNTDSRNKLKLWVPGQDHYFLSAGQTLNIYRQVGRILTDYYDVASFEQIFPWHPAAGDFIAKVENETVDVKLITARRYASVFAEPADLAPHPADAERILQAMLIFLLNLTIRMRLDRLDGVGDMVWADDIAVYGAVSGFWTGLDRKPTCALLPDAPARCFRYYLSRCTADDLLDLSRALVNALNPRAPELPAIRQNLKAHVGTLCRCIRAL